MPLLSNENNHDEWPGVVSSDILKHVNSLKTNMEVVTGQVDGKTVLPLPPGSDQVKVTEEPVKEETTEEGSQPAAEDQEGEEVVQEESEYVLYEYFLYWMRLC